MLLFGREEEVLEELRGRQVAPASEVNIFGNVGNDVYHLLVVAELQSFLGEITEAYRVANIELSAIGLHFAEQ